MIAGFESVNNYRLKKANLSYEVVEDGVVYPCIPKEDDKVKVYGCVLDCHMKPVELSFTTHCDFEGNTSIICGNAPPPFSENIDIIDEEVVWLGYFWDFYGHFLSDSLGRLWYLIKKRSLKVCFISKSDNTFIDFLRLFGLKDEQIIRVTKPLRFKRIIVPEPAFRYHDYYHESFKDILNEITADIKPAEYKKIYLSRANYNPEVPTLGEKIIEKAFSNKGFKVIYPETLSIKSQISLMKGADIVAGTSGTSMHNVLFCRDGVRTICLNRSQDILYMQLLIDEMKNLDATYVDIYQTPLPITYHSQPYLLGITEELLRFFNDYDFKFKYKIKNGKYKFPADVYENFTKDLCHWLYSWTKVNSERKDLLPEKLSTDEILDMLNNIWKVYDIKKLTKRRKNLKEKFLNMFVKLH